MADLRVGTATSFGKIPRSSIQLSKDAEDYEYDAQRSFKSWLHVASALFKQAMVYLREDDDEMAFFLLFRHAHLALTNLPAHPQMKQYAAEMKVLKKQVLDNIEIMDMLKPRLNKRHEEYMKVMQAKETSREEFRQQQRNFSGIGPYQTGPQFRQLRGSENAEYAARLAQQEFSRKGPARQSHARDKDDLSQSLQAIRARIDSSKGTSTRLNTEKQESRFADTTYNYPSVPSVNLRNHDQTPFSVRPHYERQVPVSSPPTLPPKPRELNLGAAPPRPDKVTVPSVPAKQASEPTYSFAPAAHLENGTALRTIFLPKTMRTTFLRLAHSNTTKNLETCGFLAGTLRANALFANTLIIPSQTATSDTCEMTNESELFDYVDSHELMVLGWIHTHPTQTCFMSSRDLHTHSGYQMMLAESVAIVCAPSKGDTTHGGDWGVYRLTDPPGKMAILQCEKPGIFHPHEVDNIYTDAIRPGHVMEIETMEFEVVDLRKDGKG